LQISVLPLPQWPYYGAFWNEGNPCWSLGQLVVI
jgi:hypothetical protein